MYKERAVGTVLMYFQDMRNIFWKDLWYNARYYFAKQRIYVSIKDELQHVKEELSGDEKILESAFKLERIYKKNKIFIWAAAILLIVGLGGNAAWKAYQQNKLKTANQAFLTLQSSPKDSAALKALEENNPKLYALYELSQALKDQSAEKIQSFAGSSDALVADMAKYHAAALASKPIDSVYYHDLTVVEEAYADLKAGKKSEAKSKLSLISENSPVAKIAQLLKHYTIDLN